MLVADLVEHLPKCRAMVLIRRCMARVLMAIIKSRIPMLILCGDNDPSVPATNWYPLVGQIPRAQLVVLPESGHGPQHQYPELSAKYIIAFLQQAPE